MKQPSCLSSGDIRRLLFSLIRSEQARLQREGRLSAAHCLDARIGQDTESWEALTIDEEGLGFDSLARLDLVMCVNRFFDLSSTGIEDYLLIHRTMSDWVSLVTQHLDMVGCNARLTFSSSGSTGPQTHAMHSIEALGSEVASNLRGALKEWAGTGRVLCPLPMHHIYGFLWGILLPSRADVEALDLPAGLPSPVLRNARPGDLVISTPSGWSRMGQTGTRMPEDVIGISSGGPTTKETWEAARQLGLKRLIEVYGSSETAGLGWRDDPAEPFSLLSDIRRADQGLVRPGILTGFLEVQDHLDWTDPARFHVRGRKDYIVKVGGVKVSPEHVRQHLCALPGVKDAAVRLDGDRLKSFVASDAADTAKLETALRQHLHSLPATARPDRFTFGPTLPRSETGKLQDW